MDRATTPATIYVGRVRYRIGPWHADPSVAYLTIAASRNAVAAKGLAECLEMIRRRGFTGVMTAALHPVEALPFIANGFTQFDSLVVLSHDLHATERARQAIDPDLRLRRARRRDLDTVLRLDQAAFPPAWRIDQRGLSEARDATMITRFRVADHNGDIRGYAITGRAGRMAFLQRLASHPSHAGGGIGSWLVSDALGWARKARVEKLLVNTQHTNERALKLYEGLGFVRTPTDLIVLSKAFDR